MFEIRRIDELGRVAIIFVLMIVITMNIFMVNIGAMNIR